MNASLFSRVILILSAAHWLCGSAWSGESWPQAILELERAALRDPRPGSAWLHLRQYAVAAGRYAELRQRWETGDAAGLILLGWLDVEAGEVKAARGRFERAVEVAPKNHHAWLAHAELQLRAGEAAGEVSAATAAELAGDEAGRVRALRLPGLTAQERGDLAGAWAAWKKLEAAPLAPSVRVALIPDFARAHLATGDADEWSARLVAAAPDSADAAASATAACLALGDAALAHRLVTAALARDPAHAGLRKLAVAAARGAGFNGEAAARVEAALGDAPDDDALVSALEAFTKLGAPEHAVRLCRGHAARLAPIATRWRLLLPACARLGSAADLRAIFTPLEKTGGWELLLALAELAILEEDYAAAAPWLWRLYDAGFDAREPGAAALAPGARMEEAAHLAVTGHGFHRRFADLQTLTRARPNVFATDSAGQWTQDAVYSTVISVSGARDLALAYLHSIALREGGGAGEKFRVQLGERLARWPAEERLLAWATVGRPADVLDAAAEVLARPAVSVGAAGFVRAQLARVRGVPDLPAKLLTAADTLAARLAPEEQPHAGLPVPDLRSVRALFSVMDDEVPPPGQPPFERRWRRELRACWALFAKGRFADADTRFAECLRALGAAGLSPSDADWARFHCATFHALGCFDDEAEQVAAASCALRWLALQSPRRTDWPAAVEPRMVWQTGAPRLTIPMFYSDRQGDFFAWRGYVHEHFRACGGSVPGDALGSLALTVERLGSSFPEVPLRTDGLPPESVRLLQLTGFIQTIYRGMWNGQPVGTTTGMEQMFGTADGALARLLATRFHALLHEKKSAPAGELPDFLMPGKPTGLVGRGPWLVARLQMTARQTPPPDVRALAAELAELPLDAENYAGAREALGIIAAARPPAEAAEWKALADRLAVARLRASPAEPLPGDWAERMILLTAAGKSDEALALARRTLVTPTTGVMRAEFMGRAHMQAFRTLHERGALGAWLGAMRQTAQAGTVDDWRWLAAAGQVMQQFIPEKESPTSAPAGDKREHPDSALRRESKAAFDEASLALTRLEPDRSFHWYQLHLARSPQGGPLGPLSAAGVDLAALTRGAGPGFSVENAAQFLGNDLDQLATLLERWPVRNLRVPDSASPDTTLGQELAVRLWRCGKKDAACRWLEKLFAACDASAGNASALRTILLEAHALREDRAGLVEVFARTLRDAIELQDGASGFPARDS